MEALERSGAFSMPSFVQLTLADLFDKVGPKPKHRAENAHVIAVVKRKNQKRFAYVVKAFEKYSSPDGHIVSWSYPNLIGFDKVVKYPQLTPLNRRALVHCSCPAHRYWGSNYLATRDGYELGAKETRPANIRDPEGQNFICKHLARVVMSLRDTTFADLLSEFSITSKTASTGVSLVAPAIRSALHADGWYDGAIDDLIATLDDDTLEDALERHGLIVPAE